MNLLIVYKYKLSNKTILCFKNLIAYTLLISAIILIGAIAENNKPPLKILKITIFKWSDPL